MVKLLVDSPAAREDDDDDEEPDVPPVRALAFPAAANAAKRGWI